MKHIRIGLAMPQGPYYGLPPMAVMEWIHRREAVKRAQELLAECCERLSLGRKVLGKSGKDWVARRRWGDDPQEMRRAVYYAALAASNGTVEAGHFPPRCARDHEAYAKAAFEQLSLEHVVGHKVAHFFERLGGHDVSSVHSAVIEQVERPLIQRCLAWAGGNQLKAARALGINRNTLRKKMRDLGIG